MGLMPFPRIIATFFIVSIYGFVALAALYEAMALNLNPFHANTIALDIYVAYLVLATFTINNWIDEWNHDVTLKMILMPLGLLAALLPPLYIGSVFGGFHG